MKGANRNTQDFPSHSVLPQAQEALEKVARDWAGQLDIFIADNYD